MKKSRGSFDCNATVFGEAVRKRSVDLLVAARMAEPPPEVGKFPNEMKPVTRGRKSFSSFVAVDTAAFFFFFFS